MDEYTNPEDPHREGRLLQPEDDIEVTADDLKALSDESDIMGEDFKTLAERMLDENLTRAVLQLTKLALNASNERVRLDASKYIIERSLGRLQDIDHTIKQKDSIQDLLDGVVVSSST